VPCEGLLDAPKHNFSTTQGRKIDRWAAGAPVFTPLLAVRWVLRPASEQNDIGCLA
jgi:hypothetical protein